MNYRDRAVYEEALNNPNVQAMLHTIADAEGCHDSYGCSFGGTNMNLSGPSHPYSGHDCSFSTTGPRAVGRYQFCGTTWDEVSNALGGLDFSNPRDQDLAAIALIDRRKALEQVKNGDVEGALTGTGGVSGLAYEWASLPPYRYPGQGTKDMNQIRDMFASYNGKPLGPGSTKPGSISSTASALSNQSSVGGSAQRKNCPDWDRSMRQGKILTGCDMVGSTGFGNSISIAPGATQGVPGAAGDPSLVSVPIDVADLQGKLLWPLRDSSGNKAGVRTSPYGWRNHPVSGGRRFHAGVDLSGSTHIVAAAPGVVVFSGHSPETYQGMGFTGYGNCVMIEHARPNGKIWTFYAHLKERGVPAGTQVQAGTGIGLEGNTGVGTGPHLHFEVRTAIPGGQSGTVDPWPLIDQNK